MGCAADAAPYLTRRDFTRPEDKVYIHIFSEYPDFIGAPHSHEYIGSVYIMRRRLRYRRLPRLRRHEALLSRLPQRNRNAPGQYRMSSPENNSQEVISKA